MDTLIQGPALSRQSEGKNVTMPAPYWAWVDQKADQTGSNRSQVIQWLVRVQMAAESVQTA
jgi:hypothetical protein